MPQPPNPNPNAAETPPPPETPHGTRHDPKRVHPVLDIAHWEAEFPLDREDLPTGWIDGPGDLALAEQARKFAGRHGDLGPSVPADFFTWSKLSWSDKPWLTQIGGVPWREADKPWPKDEDGIPLHFLGQICFADSKDILPCKLPGDVALIFGRWQRGYTFLPDDSTIEALEWSPLKLKKPLTMAPGWTTVLPFCYHGVIHRSVQYTDDELAVAAFAAADLTKYESSGTLQISSIGRYANLPQGWPFDERKGSTLIATLSSFIFNGRWPLCDMHGVLKLTYPDGSEYERSSPDGLNLNIGSVGCIWLYRDEDGSFKLDSACS